MRGSWHGTVQGFGGFDSGGQALLAGEGAYDGLDALLSLRGNHGFDEFEGLVFTGDLPPLPPGTEKPLRAAPAACGAHALV